MVNADRVRYLEMIVGRSFPLCGRRIDCLMSLQPKPWPEPAEEITKAVLAIYARRRAPLPVVVRDELGELFADGEFASAFGPKGHRGLRCVGRWHDRGRLDR